MSVAKINHVAILVKDLKEAGKLYADLFGIKFSGPKEEKEMDARRLANPGGIELVSPLSADGVTAKNLERRGEGIIMLGLKVANVKKATAEMKSKGIRQIGGDGIKSAMFHPKDLYGVMIELVED